MRQLSESERKADQVVAAEFGATHPEVFGGLWYEKSRLHIGLTEMTPHASELRALLPHRDAVTVEPVTYTAVELAAVLVEVERLMRSAGTSWHAVGQQVRAVRVDLGPDGVALARELQGTFGARVEITVGGRRYPPDGILPANRAGPTSTRHVAGLVVAAMPDSGRVVSGQPFGGAVLLRNTGRKAIRFRTDQPLLASILDADGRVAGSWSGAIAGTGALVDLEPGAGQEVPFVGGTAGGSGYRYSTEPGLYSVVVAVPVADRRWDRRRGHGQVVSPAVPLLVTPHDSRTGRTVD